MHLMLNRFPFLVSPPFDDSRLARRTSQPKVVPSCPPNILPIEPWLAVLNGCGELPYAHVNWEDRSISAFESCLLLDGYVYEPSLAISDEFAFSQLMLQKRFLLMWKLNWNPDAFRVEWDSNPPFEDGALLMLYFNAVASENYRILSLFYAMAILVAYPLPEPVRLLLRRRIQLFSTETLKLTLPSPILTCNGFAFAFPVQNYSRGLFVAASMGRHVHITVPSSDRI